MKKLNTILLLLGVVFLVVLVWHTGIHELGRELGLLGWGLVPFILGEGIAEMIHTVGWRHCLSGHCRSVSWSRLFQIRMAGYAINYLTPTASIGGEATKAALLASDQRGPEAVSGVLIEKVCFSLAQVLFIAFGSLLVVQRVNLPQAFWVSMLASGALVTAGILVFLLLQKRGQLGGLLRWLANKSGRPALAKAADGITCVDAALSAFYRERPWDMWLAVAWHLVGFSVGIVQTWLFFRLLGQDVSWLVASAAWFLGMWFDLLTFAVPLNAGSLEGSRIIAFRALGYTSLLGMTYGVALRLAQMFWAGVGLAIYGLLTLRGTIAAECRPDAPLAGIDVNNQSFLNGFAAGDVPDISCLGHALSKIESDKR